MTNKMKYGNDKGPSIPVHVTNEEGQGIPVGAADADWTPVLQSFAKPPQLQLIPSCVDVRRFYRKPCRLGNKVVCGGRYVESKGLEYALEAVSGITLFGRGMNKHHDRRARSLRKIATRNGAKVIGWLDRNKLRQLFSESWCLIHPSVIEKDGYKDGLPAAITEALAMGLQVITTNTAGICDVAQFCHIVPRRDADAIARAVKEAPHEFNQAGAEYVRRTHDPQRVIGMFAEEIHHRYGLN